MHSLNQYAFFLDLQTNASLKYAIVMTDQITDIDNTSFFSFSKKCITKCDMRYLKTAFQIIFSVAITNERIFMLEFSVFVSPTDPPCKKFKASVLLAPSKNTHSHL